MESKKLTIFFTSDLHAYIYPTDYRSREERNIGLFKCASRFTRDGNTLIIDGGDLLQGSPLGAFCHDTLQNAAPFAEMMNRCGYDYVTLGNHDFNYGMPYLDSYLNVLKARCVCENVRWDDDMRWGMGKLAERPWYGVYVGELDKAYDMDGDGKDDVCFVRKEPERPQAGITYRVLGDDFSLTDGDSGYIECYIRMTRKWDDKKYVRPIPTTALNDNPALGQNYGWEK